ncbi:UNVERIFIED_CONTAM: Phosphatidylglycerol/phosphatidylinositol transfer protein [Siphonaria sp. JEL0065]|nr:Phosphatidylglycerol/phosphatidylinositol transfer protein [Siphonaria sp. JEL0065]
MKHATLLLVVLCLLSLATSFTIAANQHQQNLAILETPSSFDGSIELCGSSSDVFQPSKIAMNPDPPKRGEKLDVTVIGELSEDVVDGAYINVIVKIGVIKLYQGKLDLCEESGKIGHPCPIAKGHQEVFHSVDIPREVPPGKYNIAVKVFTADDKPLTCLNIKIKL